MYQHILATTDLTKGSKPVVRKAWELANQFDATLSIVHVIEPIPAYGYPGVTNIESPHIDAVRKELAEFSQEYMIDEANQHIEVGAPKIEILDLMKKLNIDLIVVGSHGRHGIFRLLGSTASAIVNSVECDVLTVRSS